MNLELRERGFKPEALTATLVEVVQPADGLGTGGSFEKIEIK